MFAVSFFTQKHYFPVKKTGSFRAALVGTVIAMCLNKNIFSLQFYLAFKFFFLLTANVFLKYPNSNFNLHKP
jgi:hypothetical protein